MLSPLVIITGASGFIARHCAREMASRGFAVAGIDQASLPDAAGWGYSRWRSDAVSREALYCLMEGENAPNVIIHCAGSGSVSGSFDDPGRDFAANVGTALEALEAARNRDCKAFVLPSSAAVYGRTPAIPICETHPPAPVSPYGVHKRIAELLCGSYGSIFGVPTICVRLFSVYGQGLRKQLLWDACVKAAAGEFAFSGTGRELRDWLHVSDAARLLALAAEHASPECPVVNGATGVGTSTGSLLGQLGRLWNPGLVPSFSGDARRGDPADYVADVSRIAAWEFRPLADLSRELEEYVDWFKRDTA